MSETDAITDVVELCALLECVGFTLKSLDTSDSNHSQDGGTAAKTIAINCQSSGIHVVLENPAASCSCPPADPHSSGFWQVSGIASGKMFDKESGSNLLRALPKPYRERLSKQLYDMIRCIRAINDLENGSKVLNKSTSLVDLTSKSASIIDQNKSSSMVELNKEANKSASMLELGTPKKRHQLLKPETPTRYRSLDTLTKVGAPLTNPPIGAVSDLKMSMVHRQSTYTIYSKPDSVRRRNKTSSPINAPTINLLDSLIEAEKVAEDLRNKLNVVIKEFMESEKDDSSISSMLDVSKISMFKGPDSKAQFASSPNLSGLCLVPGDHHKSGLIKRFESASTSNLAKPTPEGIRSKLKRMESEKDDSSISSMLDVSKISMFKGPDSKAQFASSPNLSELCSVPEDHHKSGLIKRFESASTSNLAKPTPEGIRSKLKRISPNIFKTKKDLPTAKDKDARSKLQSVLKPRIVTPIRTNKIKVEASPNLNSSANKKKFSHIKSTIPRPTPKKE